VGTHAICVGFPEKTHFAFDARQARVALAWKGRFLDAHGTWYDRFVPPAKPLGTDVVPIADGPGAHDQVNAVPWPEDNGRLLMKGYRLVDGIPTFRYQIGSTQVRDRLTPEKGGIRRKIEVAAPTRPIWIQLGIGETVKRNGSTIQIDRLIIHGDALERAVVVGEKPRRVVLQVDRATSISVSYQW
jgi:hypothetical protein